MNGPSFSDFARVVTAHSHGNFYASVDSKTQTTTLGRHLVRQPSEQENRAVRLAFYDAISRSGYLDGQRDALAAIKRQLGIMADGKIVDKPLSLRDVHAMIDDVRQAGRGTLSLLLDEGFPHRDVVLLKAWMPEEKQQYYVAAFADVRGKPLEEGKLVAQLRRELSEAKLSEQLLRGVACRKVETLTPFLAQKLYGLKTLSPSLSVDLVVSVVERNLEARSTAALAARAPGPETAKALRKFVLDCLDEALTLALKTDDLEQKLWEDAFEELDAFQKDLPSEGGHLVGFDDVGLYHRDRVDMFTSSVCSKYFDPERGLESLAAETRESFRLGAKFLLGVSHSPDGRATEAEVRVRAMQFADRTFEKYFRTKLEHIDLPAFDDTRLREAVSRRTADEAMEEVTKLDSPLAAAFSSADTQLSIEAMSLERKLETLAERKSAAEAGVSRSIDAQLDARGLGDCTEDERAAVRSAYERLYARDVVANCGDPDLLLGEDALDEATDRAVKDAVDCLVVARGIADGVLHRNAQLQSVKDFRASEEVTDQMREAFDAFMDDLVRRARVELTSDTSAVTIEALSARFKDESERRIVELQKARREHLRARVSERYRAIRDDFDMKIPAVEEALEEFEKTLEPLDARFGREVLRAIVPKAEFSGIHDMWIDRCDELRARYETEPTDFDPNKPDLSKFNDARFLRTLKKELAEAWRTRGDLYVGAVGEIEDSLRAAGLPDGVGLTTDTLSAHQFEPRAQELVADAVMAIKEAAFQGESGRVRELLDGLKGEIGRFIARHNDEVFAPHGPLDVTGVQSTRAYAKIAFGNLRAKEKVLWPKEGFEAWMFEAGYRDVRRSYAEDGVRYHTEEELLADMKSRYDQVVALWGRMTSRVHHRIVDRAESHLFEIASSVTAEGTFRANFEILIHGEAQDELLELITNEQKRMLENPLGYDAEQAMRTRVDPAVDRIIERAMAPTGEQRREIQSLLVDRARSELVAYAEGLAKKMTTRLLNRSHCTKEMLMSTALQFVNVFKAKAMAPVVDESDGRIHALSYRAPDVEALKRELETHLEDFSKKYERGR